MHPSITGSATGHRLAPMGIGDILDETFRLLRENFLLFICITALLQAPLTILGMLLTNHFISPDLQVLEQRLRLFDQQIRAGGSVDNNLILHPLGALIADAAKLAALYT